MDRENARQEIKRRISCTEYLQKSKGGMYCCPNPECGSGTKANGTGAVKFYPETNSWHCFSCDMSGDVIDLFRMETGADYNGALSLMAQEIGITIDEYKLSTDASHKVAGSRRNAKSGERDIKAQANTEGETDGKITANYEGYYQECRERLQDPAAMKYLQSRGISPETAAAYWVGYDPASDPSEAGHKEPRIILPTCATHYVARAINESSKIKKLNPKGSTPGIFNLDALYEQDAQEVFITEGIFDALAIIEKGATAIATCSTSNAKKLIEQLEKERTEAVLILAFDNDDAGKKATETMRQGLQRLNISYTVANICGNAKDPNAALIQDPEAFAAAISTAKAAAAAKPDNVSSYIDNLMGEDIAKFAQNEIKSGFANFDRIKVDGKGYDNFLYPGLYCIAAIPSLGKTTIALQMADQIAAGGHDVLFFSLEMSRLELVTKSLSRITAQTDVKTAVTSLQIRKGNITQSVLAAAEQYKKTVGDRLSIVEGNFCCSVSFIRSYIEQYMRRNPKARPVIFLDYLQILQPESTQGRQQTTKEVVDSTTTELKRLSREYGLTIIAISSVNRANYTMPIDFESLKETGNIEYCCDCVLGLQLQCIRNDLFNQDKKTKQKRDKIKEASAAIPRKIELTCLKNRFGISKYSVFFDYDPRFDLFTTCSEAALDFETDEPPKKTRRRA